MVRHIYGDCSTVRLAFDKCVAKGILEFTGVITYELPTSTLAVGLSPEECHRVLCFNFAVWIVHQKTRHRVLSPRRRANLIFDLARDKIVSLASARRKKRKRKRPVHASSR